MIIKSYCGYDTDRRVDQILCPITIFGKEHLHTECRACRHNVFDFYTTLKVIRRKMSDISPKWNGVYPEIAEPFVKHRKLED